MVVAGPCLPLAEPARRVRTSVSLEVAAVLRLPTGLLARIRAVSTRPDRWIDVPRDTALAGRWRGRSLVGDPFGVMLVAAHIDSSAQGLGPFSELLIVLRGQKARVSTTQLRRADTVRSSRLIHQGTSAGQPWLHLPAGGPRLNLVTCAPLFDAARGCYKRLEVATAVAQDPRRRKRAR